MFFETWMKHNETHFWIHLANTHPPAVSHSRVPSQPKAGWGHGLWLTRLQIQLNRGYHLANKHGSMENYPSIADVKDFKSVIFNIHVWLPDGMYSCSLQFPNQWRRRLIVEPKTMATIWRPAGEILHSQLKSFYPCRSENKKSWLW